MGKSKVHISIRLIFKGEFTSWNIYHLACLSPHPKRDEFVAHLLKTLPVDLTHELIAQTSKEASNTVQYSIRLADAVSLTWRCLSL